MLIIIDTDYNLLNNAKILINEFYNTINKKHMVIILFNSNCEILYKKGEFESETIDSKFSLGERLISGEKYDCEMLREVLNIKEPVKTKVEPLRGLVGLAVPIINKEGDIIGIIGVFCPETIYTEEIFGAIKIISKSISKESAYRTLEQQISQQSKYEKAIVESISDGFMTVDKRGVITYLNRKGFEILGVTKDVIGKNLREITDFEPELFDVLKTGKGWVDKEFIIDMKGKKNLHLVKTAIPVFDDRGNVLGVIDTFKEIKKVRNLVNKMTGAKASFTFKDIVYKSKAMHEIIKFAKKVAASDSSILIQGESGTGKELFAHAIHDFSPRRNGPFVTIDCSTIPHDLVESELFGYVEGAFTGARRGGRPGKFEMANCGTIFLDEIGEMSPDVQKKFLRVLQTHTVTRLGDHVPIPIDIRVIAATNRNLEKEVEEKNFRDDLFYRLNVINIHIPPLRKRKDDIIPTAEYFIKKIGKRIGKENIILAEETKVHLMNYSWPGNVRELKNIIERALNLVEGNVILPDLLPNKILNYKNKSVCKNSYEDNSYNSLEEFEKEKIISTLKLFNGNKKKTAEVLGIARSTLYEKIKKYDLDK